MPHNFQEVIDELHRGRELLTSTSGTQGDIDKISALITDVHHKISGYCSDLAWIAAINLTAAQHNIDNIKSCILRYCDANEQLITELHGNSNNVGRPWEAQHHEISSPPLRTADNNSIDRSQISNSTKPDEADSHDTNSCCSDSTSKIKHAKRRA